MNTEQQPKAPRLYRNRQIRERLGGIGNSTLYEYVNRYGLPKPIKFANGHSVVWDADAVDAWIASQFEKARQLQGLDGVASEAVARHLGAKIVSRGGAD